MKFKRSLDRSFISGFSACIYASGGAGKTSMVKMLPPDETLYISIDDSSFPIRERNFYYVQLPKPTQENPTGFVKELNNVYESIRTDKNCPFKYIVIDSISELERYFTYQSIYKRNDMKRQVDIGDSIATLKDYGDAAVLTYKYIINFRDLKNSSNTASGNVINTFFIANEMSEEIIKTETKTLKKILPFLTGKTSAKLRDAVDILGYIQVLDNGERQLQLNPSQEIEAKNRFQTLQSHKIDFNYDIMKSFVNIIKMEIAAKFGIGNSK